MKKLILDNVLVVEIDEDQEMELAQLFPDLEAAFAQDSEVRVEIKDNEPELWGYRDPSIRAD